MPLISTFGAASVYGYLSTTPKLDPTLISQTNTSGTANFSIPSSAAVGDIAVLVDSTATVGSTPSAVVPAGWTSVIDTATAGFNWRVISSFKLLTAGDPGASFTGMSGITFNRKILLIFRKATVATAVTAFSAAGEMTTGDPAAQVVTSSGGTAPVIVIAYYGSNGAITGNSFSPAATGDYVVNTLNIMSYKTFTSSPVNVTVDMGDYGSNVMQSYYLQIS